MVAAQSQRNVALEGTEAVNSLVGACVDSLLKQAGTTTAAAAGGNLTAHSSVGAAWSEYCDMGSDWTCSVSNYTHQQWNSTAVSPPLSDIEQSSQYTSTLEVFLCNMLIHTHIVILWFISVRLIAYGSPPWLR